MQCFCSHSIQESKSCAVLHIISDYRKDTSVVYSISPDDCRKILIFNIFSCFFIKKSYHIGFGSASYLIPGNIEFQILTFLFLFIFRCIIGHFSSKEQSFKQLHTCKMCFLCNNRLNPKKFHQILVILNILCVFQTAEDNNYAFLFQSFQCSKVVSICIFLRFQNHHLR